MLGRKEEPLNAVISAILENSFHGLSIVTKIQYLYQYGLDTSYVKAAGLSRRSDKPQAT
jgi:hypothetical protein